MILRFDQNFRFCTVLTVIALFSWNTFQSFSGEASFFWQRWFLFLRWFWELPKFKVLYCFQSFILYFMKHVSKRLRGEVGFMVISWIYQNFRFCTLLRLFAFLHLNTFFSVLEVKRVFLKKQNVVLRVTLFDQNFRFFDV